MGGPIPRDSGSVQTSRTTDVKKEEGEPTSQKEEKMGIIGARGVSKRKK